MKRKSYFLAFALACSALLICGSRVMGADEPAKVAGTWEMTIQGGPEPFTQTLTIQQDGSTIKGSVKGERGESPLEGSVAGNKINFTVKLDTPDGTMTIEHTGTIDGDSMKGTFHMEQFDGEWTAKRVNETGEK
jgi:hypothetical protein